MAVDVDEARDRHEALAVDRGVDRAGKARADMDDLVALEHQVGAVEIDVALLGLVPGDDVIEVRDAGGSCCSSVLPFARPDWHDRAMTSKTQRSRQRRLHHRRHAVHRRRRARSAERRHADRFLPALRRPWLHPARHDGRGAQADRRRIDRRREPRDRPRPGPPGDRGREPRRPRERAAPRARGHDRRRLGRDGGAAGRASRATTASTITMRRSSPRSGPTFRWSTRTIRRPPASICSPPVFERLVDDFKQLVMLKHEDAPGLAKLTRVREGEKKPGRRRVSILVGNGGLYLSAGDAARRRRRDDRLRLARDAGAGLRPVRRRQGGGGGGPVRHLPAAGAARGAAGDRPGAAQGSAVQARRDQEPEAARAGLVADGHGPRRARGADRAAGAPARRLGPRPQSWRRSRGHGRLRSRHPQRQDRHRGSPDSTATSPSRTAASRPSSPASKGKGSARDRCRRQVRPAGRHRQPLPHRAEVGLRHHVRRRLLHRHRLGGVRRHDDGDPLRRPASRHVAAPGGEGLSRGGDAQGGDRLRLPPDRHRSQRRRRWARSCRR